METILTWFGDGRYAFEGVVRWSLWLGNPNKAAMLFAEVAILGIWMTGCRKISLTLTGLALFILSVIGLLHTFSRGGIIACLVGIGIVLYRRKISFVWLKKTTIAATLLLCAYGTQLGVHRRCLQGVTTSDASISNRIILWSAAPAMFRAAPYGWGIGNSGDAYMKWFQPVDRYERYRTLVNSHLTWMVELGWILSFAYVMAWCIVMQFTNWMSKSIDGGVSLGEISSLFIGGMFSSVLESPWLWIIPTITIIVSTMRPKSGLMFAIQAVPWAAFVAAILVALLLFMPSSCIISIRKLSYGIKYGEGDTKICLFADPDVVGGEFWMRELRRDLKSENVSVITMQQTCDALSTAMYEMKTADAFVFSGDMYEKAVNFCLTHSNKRILVLSPSLRSYEKTINKNISQNVHFLVGEFAEVLQDKRYGNTTIFEGIGQYIPNWIEKVLSHLQSNVVEEKNTAHKNIKVN